MSVSVFLGATKGMHTLNKSYITFIGSSFWLFISSKYLFLIWLWCLLIVFFGSFITYINFPTHLSMTPAFLISFLFLYSLKKIFLLVYRILHLFFFPLLCCGFNFHWQQFIELRSYFSREHWLHWWQSWTNTWVRCHMVYSKRKCRILSTDSFPSDFLKVGLKVSTNLSGCP